MEITAFKLASRYRGIKEVRGQIDNPTIMAMLKLDVAWPEHDEVPWCSAFVNWIAWHLEVPRSKSLMARSWLDVGYPVILSQAKVGWDVVILKRGSDPNLGHVGFYAGYEKVGHIWILSGNQKDMVCLQPYAINRVVGVRRLHG